MDQVSLGGSNCLRGFQSHSLNGNASVKFTVEERLFTDYHLFHLLRVGVAAFFDAGKVYGDPNPAAFGVFKDAGIGLRLAPSKSESGQVIHIDAAWPMGGKLHGGDSMELVIGVKRSF